MKPAAILLTILLTVAAGCGIITDPAPDSRQNVTVTRVIDGDTVEVSPAVDGREDVRLIGIDTPETFDPSGSQPYATEAAQFTENRLEDRRVELEFDAERVDPYGRALAYVRLPRGGNRTFNETLVREGYAQVATFPPNTRYLQRFERAQRDARAARHGIWSLPISKQCRLTDRGNGVGGC